MSLAERLAKKCAGEQYAKIPGLEYDKWMGLYMDHARWWLNAIADELEDKLQTSFDLQGLQDGIDYLRSQASTEPTGEENGDDVA